ncbi:MAG: ABC-type dipeptide/oligopeptide/nickel transport system, permease component [Candidatus Methanohalarchaeum thermophilum]|uniref:ABC-type dipeptide/oligopeptide/nickel transport system, permease component n=1 Tax=Methanohalarchaeum thermophilum TaxID=1903181 RepID=A0A1Q6DTW0_METT1|nr:MAG: ABC-type dipeptide/oligopeptide/nickel transport system, permease component [Candidatus Methanohalarchaeum thermophilum]
MKNRIKEFKKRMAPRIEELQFTIDKIKQSPLTLVALFIILFFVFIAIFAPYLAPPKGSDPYMMPNYGYSATPSPPSEEAVFGTTQQQYDLYYGCIWGARTAFKLATPVLGLVFLIGTGLGLISGYYGGIIDEIIMRSVDTVFAFPYIILAVTLVIALGQGLSSMIIALTVAYWPFYARVMRGEVLKQKEKDYVKAAESLGASDARIMIKHIVPNSIYPVLILASLDFGAIVIAGATLSFFGIGFPIGYSSWGQLASFARDWVSLNYWWATVIPGLFISIFVLGWNLLGDSIRDVMDPTIRRE